MCFSHHQSWASHKNEIKHHKVSLIPAGNNREIEDTCHPSSPAGFPWGHSQQYLGPLVPSCLLGPLSGASWMEQQYDKSWLRHTGLRHAGLRQKGPPSGKWECKWAHCQSTSRERLGSSSVEMGSTEQNLQELWAAWEGLSVSTIDTVALIFFPP